MGFLDIFWHKYLRRPYRLDYMDTGNGRQQTAVLLHGIAASKDIWLPLVEELSPETWRVLVPDLLGFGSSPKPQWPEYTVQDQARAVLAFMKQQGVKKPVVLVGHSMGCLVATHIAAISPKSVSRLVLYEPPLLSDAPELPGLSKRSVRYKALFEYIASHPQLAHLENKILWRVARKISGLYLTPEEWLPFERSLRNTILEQQAYDELKVVDKPTDIVYGRLDFIVIRQGIKDMFHDNKNIKLHLVTDTHGISVRSARYLASLLGSVLPKRAKREKAKRKTQVER